MANSDAYLDWTGAELEKSYNVYVAVYALAHALENVRSCKNGYGLLEVSTRKGFKFVTSSKMTSF